MIAFLISARLMINDCVNARFCFPGSSLRSRMCSKRFFVGFKDDRRAAARKREKLYVIFRIARTYTKVSERFNPYEWPIIYFNYATRAQRWESARLTRNDRRNPMID